MLSASLRSVADALARTRPAPVEGQDGGGAQSRIPQEPASSQQPHEACFVCNGSTGCTCAMAVQKAARRSQTKRFMDEDISSGGKHPRNFYSAAPASGRVPSLVTK